MLLANYKTVAKGSRWHSNIFDGDYGRYCIRTQLKLINSCFANNFPSSAHFKGRMYKRFRGNIIKSDVTKKTDIHLWVVYLDTIFESSDVKFIYVRFAQ